MIVWELGHCIDMCRAYGVPRNYYRIKGHPRRTVLIINNYIYARPVQNDTDLIFHMHCIVSLCNHKQAHVVIALLSYYHKYS